MPILRLAYTTQFLLALLAVFFLWSEVGGQSHLDLMPWYVKLVLGGGAAFATVKATASAVSQQRAWNGRTLRWVGILLALLVACGLATYYVHLYGEQDEEPDDSTVTSGLVQPLQHDTLLGDAQAGLAGIHDICGAGLRLGAGRPSVGGPSRRRHAHAGSAGASARDSGAN